MHGPEDSAVRQRLCLVLFSSRRRHTRCLSDWSSDVCSSDLWLLIGTFLIVRFLARFTDRDRCLDAGGAYDVTLESCLGATPKAELLLDGGGSWELWLFVLAISFIIAFVAFRVVTWADGHAARFAIRFRSR